MTNNMALQICGKMLYLPKLILTIDCTIGCAKVGTFCLEERHKIGDVAGPQAYQLFML